MIEIFKEIYRRFCPYGVKKKIHLLRIRLHLSKSPEEYEKERFLKIRTGTYMGSLQEEECEYMLREGRALIFPYPWTKEYRPEAITVFMDNTKRMPYVILDEGRRMYFPRSFSRTDVMEYFTGILMEQDRRSPHYYFNPKDEKLKNSVFLDIGGAEGYITLMVLPYVKEAVVFECDKQWVTALDATFKPYRDKVRIVPKFAGRKDSEDAVCIDSVVNGKDNVVLKIDVEGMEKEVLSGAVKTLDKADTKVYVCVYHKKNDEKELGRMLKQHGFQIKVSDGWMYYGGADASFRRGIIRAEKRAN